MHAFILKTQQLNQETPVYTTAHSRCPSSTKIVIPTLKSLSVRGSGAKKMRAFKKDGGKKAVSKPSKADDAGLKAQKALDASLEKQSAGLKLLKARISEFQKQLDQDEKVPAKKAAVKTLSVSNKTSAP
ncbi:MAG: hypothetical protein ACI8PW_001400 [Methylophilaceae bacterium]|jgi:hypothetical protein